jgi:hypothetical protein
MKTLFRESIAYGIGGVVLLVGGIIKDYDQAQIVGLVFILYSNVIERIDNIKSK